MKKSRILGMMGAVLALSMVGAPATMAWGPQDRPTYTMQEPARKAVFNSIIDNAGVGNEMDFVRVAERGNGDLVSDLTIEPGKDYVVYIYYHNDASETFNDAAHGYVGVARNVRVASSFPHSLEKGAIGTIFGRISADNTDPKEVWDEAYIRASESMKIRYIANSAQIHMQSIWPMDNAILPDALFTNEGTAIGLTELNGVILGCDRYAGNITYVLRTEAIETTDPDPEKPTPGEPTESEEPETPVTPDKPVTPDVPKELPNTGPAEVALAAVIVLIVVAGVAYWAKTHKAVKKATRKAKGRK